MVLQDRGWFEAYRISRYQAHLDQEAAGGYGSVPFGLRNGMRPPIPVVTIRIDRVVPNPWRLKKRSGSYALHIGRVLKIEQWEM